jgi:hypothetical protein
VKVRSPLGDYDYRVERVAVHDGQLEVTGSLGQWETTMVIERADLIGLARHAAPALAFLSAIAVVNRRRKRVRGVL